MSRNLALLRSEPPAAADPRTTRTLGNQVGVPPRFTDCRLESFENRQGTTKALEAAQRVASDDRGDRGLVLAGPPGTGKTHLAVGILASRVETWRERYPNAVIDQPDGSVAIRPDLDIRFVVVPSLLDQLRIGIAFQGVEDPLPELMRSSLVVLDDLGREKSTDWAIERLYVLVNERYNHRLPTIVTTNYAPSELAARGYDALVSRLMEAGEVAVTNAPDYRAGRSS